MMDVYLIQRDGDLVKESIATTEREAYRKYFLMYLSGSGVNYLSDHVVWNLMENSKDMVKCVHFELAEHMFDNERD